MNKHAAENQEKMLDNEGFLSWMDGNLNRRYTWDDLPDLGLYMDQVITYLERTLDSEEKSITSSMINNYVKAKLIERPNGKKYSREHIANLLMLLSIKQIMPLSYVPVFLNHDEKKDSKEWFNNFCDAQCQAEKQVFDTVKDRLSGIGGEDTAAIKMAALHLILEANMRQLAAQKLLQQIIRQEDKPEKDNEERKR